ncbi:MAG: MXAN_5187 C-terminal domain-containing protein [Thermoanaerobaculia bacterium]
MAATIDGELNELDRNLTTVRIEYERFFAGDLKQPPLVSRRRVEETLKRLGNGEVDKPAERFRLQALQSRFNAMRELWEKRLVAREEGRPTLGGRRPSPLVAPPPSEPAHQASSDASSPGSVETRRRVNFAPLFERYVAARENLGEDVSKIRYEKFEELVRKQAEEIKRRTGSVRLAFEVQTIDGKVRLIGRPAVPKGTP